MDDDCDNTDGILCEDVGHGLLADVVPLHEHVLELGVDVLDLLTHLLQEQRLRHWYFSKGMQEQEL